MSTRVFIASSTEGLPLAQAVEKGLRLAGYDCTLWNKGVFKLSEYTLPSLETALYEHDYGVFVLSPDDKLISRCKRSRTARDNVIFELGMFIGRLNFEHCFVVQPDDMNLHLPSDLTGWTTARYSSDSYLDDPDKRVEKACTEIRNAITSTNQGDDAMRRVNEEALAYINVHGEGSFTQQRLLDSPYAVTQHLLDVIAQGDWYTSWKRIVSLTLPQENEPGVRRTIDIATRIAGSNVYESTSYYESSHVRDLFVYTKLLIDDEDVTERWNSSRTCFTDPSRPSTSSGVHFEIPWAPATHHKIHAEYETRPENPILWRSRWQIKYPIQSLDLDVTLDRSSALEWTLVSFPPTPFRNDNKENASNTNTSDSVGIHLHDWVLPGTCISWVAYHGTPDHPSPTSSGVPDHED